jgi:hypothetical protein
MVDGAGQRTVLVLDRDGHAPGRQPVEEVDGAVQRVDDPAQAAGPAPRGLVLLGEQPVVGTGGGQLAGDQQLGLAVGLRDRVGGRRLGVDHQLAEAVGVALQQPAGLLGDPHGQLSQRLALCGGDAHPKNTSATRNRLSGTPL